VASSADQPPVRLQLLIRSDARDESSVGELLTRLRQLELEPSTIGLAAISVRVHPDVFARVFGARPLADADADARLPIPESVQKFVESVSIAPYHIALNERGSAKAGAGE
jgi:hypothetical protein